MMDTAAWQDQNTQHLTAALSAIRARLQQHARPDPTEVLVPEPAPGDEARSTWRLFGRKPGPPGRHAAGIAGRAGRRVGAVRCHSTGASPIDTAGAPALVMLTQRLGLTPFERDLLLLCAGMELDTGFASWCARAGSEQAVSDICAGAHRPAGPRVGSAFARIVRRGTGV